jgi:hypothetical protein
MWGRCVRWARMKRKKTKIRIVYRKGQRNVEKEKKR